MTTIEHNPHADDDVRHDRFTTLYERYHRDVLRFARRRVDSDTAYDVVHDTFLVVWRRLDDVPEHTRPWILTIAHHTIGNRLRGQRRLEEASLRAASAPAAPQETPEDHATRMDLARAWDGLDLADREVIALVAWDSLTAAEAAEVLGCTAGAFRVRLTRARARLRVLLGHGTTTLDPRETR